VKTKYKFKPKFCPDKRLSRGGRKTDSNYYRRHLGKKKINCISYLIRNTDQILITSSVVQPAFKTGLIDRLILLSHIEKASPVICITKTDLASAKSEYEVISMIYKASGCPVYFTSIITGEGLEQIRSLLSHKKTAIVGHSGTGKTSLLRAIDPHFNEQIQEVSDYTGKGKHTTRKVCLRDLSFGGIVYDMPGLKEMDFIDLNKQDLSHYYPEFKTPAIRCRFSDCTHAHETECGVKNAVADGLIHAERYENYLNILNSLEL